MVQETKAKHYSTKMLSSDNTAKTVWGIVNQVNNKRQQIIANSVKINDSIVEEPLLVANAFINHFSNVSVDVLNKMTIK